MSKECIFLDPATVAKGQINSEWIYKIINFQKMTRKFLRISALRVFTMVVPAFIVFSFYYWSGLTVYTSMS
jgi:hypothetical protein